MYSDILSRGPRLADLALALGDCWFWLRNRASLAVVKRRSGIRLGALWSIAAARVDI